MTKGGFAILDQGLISGSNFLISILLARWLVASAVRRFFDGVLGFSFSFVRLSVAAFGTTGCLQRFSVSPMPAWIPESAAEHSGCRHRFWACVAGRVRGNRLRDGQSGRFPRSARWCGDRFSVHSVFWLLRRSYYMNLAPARAAMGAFLYFVLTTGGLFVAYRKAWISPFSAYLLMAIGALGTGLFLLSQIKKALPADTCDAPTAAQAWKKHWEYGRWALGVSVVTWIPYYMYYPLVSMFSGMAQAGQLRAVMNLALPLEQSYTALSILFLPYAARICREKGISSSGPLVRRITMLFVAGSVFYWAILIPFKGVAFHLLYGGKYMELAPLIPYVALGTTLWSAAFGPAILLRAIESPDSIFYARIVASVLSLVVGVPATKYFGLWGVVWSSDRRQYRSLFDFDVHPPAQVEFQCTTESDSPRGKLVHEHSEDTPFQGLPHEAAHSQVVVGASRPER